MSFHLVAYSQSFDSATITPINALADPSITVSGQNIQIPDFASNLAFAMGIGANLTRAQLQSPSLRRIAHYEINPLVTTLSAAFIYPPFLGYSPIPLDAGEQMQAYCAENAAGASQGTVIVMLSDGALEPVSGEIYTIRVTSATTLSAYNWTNGTLVFDQQLPVGTYQVVGAHFWSSNMLAFRFVFQGSTPRPGYIARPTDQTYAYPNGRRGAFGVWGEFRHNTPPTVDFLATAADTSEVGVLDLIKVE